MEKSMEYKLLTMSKELDDGVKTDLRYSMNIANNKISQLEAKCNKLETENKEMRLNEKTLVDDLLKHENLAKETMKAMEKLVK